MIHRIVCRLTASLVLAMLHAMPAQAHHPMDGATPVTFTQGLLSGLGHPVIGIDHLAFVIAAGLLAGFGGLRLAVPLGLIAASIAGVGIHLAGIALPGLETAIAVSVLLAGAVLVRGKPMPNALIPVLVLAGVLHGYAYGESVIGAQTGPLVAYLAGLALIQGMLAIGTALLVRRAKAGAGSWMPRAGVLVSLAGAVSLSLQFAN